VLESPEARAIRERLEAQRDEALRLANRKRMAKSALRKGIRDGSIDPLLLLDGHLDEREIEIFTGEMVAIGDALASCRIGDLLLDIPRFGKQTRKEIMRELSINTDTKFKDLSPSRRQDLTHVVRLLKWKPA
jgi:hypothetical protein